MVDRDADTLGRSLLLDDLFGVEWLRTRRTGCPVLRHGPLLDCIHEVVAGCCAVLTVLEARSTDQLDLQHSRLYTHRRRSPFSVGPTAAIDRLERTSVAVVPALVLQSGVIDVSERR